MAQSPNGPSGVHQGISPMELCVPSASLQKMPSCARLHTRRVGCQPKGPAQAQEVAPWEYHEV